MVPDVDISFYDQQGCLHNMFIRQALKTPNKIAVVSACGKKITFEELNSVTDILATKLQSYGVKRNMLVGIFMERCIEYTISYIAILKAGGAYLPIEMSYPEVLIKSVLDDAKPLVICTKSMYKYSVNYSVPLIFLENNWIERFRDENEKLEFIQSNEVLLDDMAYTVYSSGTTGKPKGIQCPHRGAVFSYTWRHLAFPYDNDDREASNIYFVWEMLRPLLKGITMYVIPDTTIYDPPLLLKFLFENKITRVLFTPSLLQIILDTHEQTVCSSFKYLKQIWLCGEVVSVRLRNRAVSLLPHVRILNLYSISECHDIAVSDLSDKIDLVNKSYCPVGKILPSVTVAVLDKDNNLKLPGDIGDVYVGGPTLAIGYLNRPELNEEQFIQTPSKLIQICGPRLYKTGDSGYILSDGSLEIIGRSDSAVRIRGYNVEVKAVEEALLSISEISMACVVSEEIKENEMLIAFIVLHDNCCINARDVKSNLKKLLPLYMIPSKFVFLNKIPILEASGKMNKKELQELLSSQKLTEDNVSCNDILHENTRKIAEIWLDVLCLPCIDTDDNFFDLGGHSLLAALTISKINNVFDKNLCTYDLYLNPTVKSLSRKVNDENTNDKIDLKKELNSLPIVQISSFKLRSFWKSVNLSKEKLSRGNLFLTGSTGFLGSFILQYLLQNTNLVLYCLIRCTKTEDAKNRAEKILKRMNLPLKLLNTRLIPIEGDVSLNKFGLDEMEYAVLCQDIDTVIHCASHVNLVFPYHILYKTNVIGTVNVLSFCTEEKLKPLQYISSGDVFPNDIEICDENSHMFEYSDKLKYGYGQTKWIAEQLIKQASKNGLPTIISRCGNIGGSLNYGIANENDMTLLILKGILFSKTIPDIPWQIELTPVDFVSEVIVKLTQNITKLFGKIFHIFNTDTIDFKYKLLLINNPLYCSMKQLRTFYDILTLKNIFEKLGYKLMLIPYEEWVISIQNTVEEYTEVKLLLPLINTILRTSDYLVNVPKFKRDNLLDFLNEIHLSYPRLTPIMKKYVLHLVDNSFLPPPVSPKCNTLLPLVSIYNVELPLRKLPNGKIVGAHSNDPIEYYPDVPEILQKLKNSSIQMALNIHGKQQEAVTQLLELFGWKQYFPNIISRRNSWVRVELLAPLTQLKEELGINFCDIIFFESEARCLQAGRQLGMFTVQILPEQGMTMSFLLEALKKYDSYQRRKRKITEEIKTTSVDDWLSNKTSTFGSISRFFRPILNFFFNE